MKQRLKNDFISLASTDRKSSIKKHSRVINSVKIWNSVLTDESIDQIFNFIDQISLWYKGESYWCSANSNSVVWNTFFSKFFKIAINESVAGVEWWIRRQHVSNSKDFHFDNDERLFKEKKEVTCPKYGSIFNLTDHGGATVISNQTDEDYNKSLNPYEFAIVVPIKNQFSTFQGDLSHAVLAGEGDSLRYTLIMNWWTEKPYNIIELSDKDIVFPRVDYGNIKSSKPKYIEGNFFEKQ